MTKWQSNVLFIVGVGGAVLLLIGADIGLKSVQNPYAFTGIGLILTYVLTQKETLTRTKSKKPDKEEEGDEE